MDNKNKIQVKNSSEKRVESEKEHEKNFKEDPKLRN